MKVLLLMSDTGGGHRAAALAIQEDIKRLDPAATVEIVDIIKEMSPFWFRVVSLYGPIVRKAPWFWGLLFKIFGNSNHAPMWKALVPIIVASVRHRMMPYVERVKPDMVLSTHPLINQCIQHARELVEKRTGKHIPFVVVVTDPVTFHPSWIEPGTDIIVVATEEARQSAIACGAPASHVRVMGLPIHPNFFATGGTGPEGTLAARRELALPEDARVVLLTGGGEGLDTMDAMAARLLALPQAPHVLAVAGRNARVQAQLEARAATPEGKRLTAMGFTNKMGLLMRASDIIVTKAGPGTMFEAMALGKPMVIADRIPGQEEGNVELVKAHSIGRVALGSVDGVAAAVAELLGNEEERKGAAQRSLELSRPNASRDIATALLALRTDAH